LPKKFDRYVPIERKLGYCRVDDRQHTLLASIDDKATSIDP